MACQWQKKTKKNCWCDIRKFMGPQGGVCAWMMCTVCVIIVLSPEAPVGVLPRRQHSPWWASPGTITGNQAACDSRRFYVPNVLTVWTAYLSITVDFSLSAVFVFFFLPFSYFPYSLLRRLSLFICRFRTLENVNDMQQPAWRLPEL